MSSGYLRPIASAQDAPQQRLSPPESRPRSIPVACSHCRTRKARCDGARPSCTRCNGLQLTCEYDVTPGVSRAGRFKLQKQRQTSVTNNLTTFIDLLSSGSDLEATTVLARLRLGESVEEIVQSLSTNLHSPLGSDRTCTTESEAASNQDSTTNTPGLEPIEDRLATNGAHLDLSVRGEVSISTTASEFLCVIFEREEFRLSASSREDDENSYRDTVVPPVLPRTQHNPNTTQLRSLDDDKSRLYTTRESTSYLTCKPTSVPFSGEHTRHLRGSWALYPEPQSNLTTTPSIIDQAIGHPNMASKASLRNLSVPLWAMMCVNTRSGSGSINLAFSRIQELATGLVREGTPREEVFGSKPNIAALYDEEAYNSSPILSQWAASMVHSVKLKGYDFTCFASLYVFWYLMRWMISLSQETYDAMPKWLRPTPNQLFIPHIHMLDFVIWPKLREFAVSTPPMQEKMDWLMDLSTHIKCQWPSALEEAIQKDPETGYTILTNHAEEHMATLSNWSLGPTFRAYVPNADLYVSIRGESG